MNARMFLPGWVKDIRRRNRDTRNIETALRSHSETLRGLTVMLEREVESLKAEVREP